MKISSVKTFIVEENGRNWLIVRIDTDTGIVGYGEASLGARTKTTEMAVIELSRYLMGKDPTEIERHWQAMYRFTFWKGGVVLATAISGVEQALWDILGKSLGAPVYRLLGGACRDKVKAYTHLAGGSPEELAENARKIVKRGFTAMKLITHGANEYNFTTVPQRGFVMPERPIKETVARVAAVREAVGEKVDIMLDAHGRLDPRTSTILAGQLEPYNLLFFEEPIPPENIRSLSRVCKASKIPIATGERLYTKYDFMKLLELNSVDVIQPDVCHAGGILECKKIAAMAECYYVTVAPHNPNGPIGTLAAIQLDACIPNFLIQEMLRPDIGRPSVLLRTPLKFDGGYVSLPTSPGLGSDVNEEALESSPYRPIDAPLATFEDGTISDW